MIISTLLTIKTVRLERSKQAVDQQMLTVQAARYRYQQSVEEQQAFAQWRIAEETRLFEACKARVLDQHGLTQWQQRVAELQAQPHCFARVGAIGGMRHEFGPDLGRGDHRFRAVLGSSRRTNYIRSY